MDVPVQAYEACLSHIFTSPGKGCDRNICRVWRNEKLLKKVFHQCLIFHRISHIFLSFFSFFKNYFSSFFHFCAKSLFYWILVLKLWIKKSESSRYFNKTYLNLLNSLRKTKQIFCINLENNLYFHSIDPYFSYYDHNRQYYVQFSISLSSW